MSRMPEASRLVTVVFDERKSQTTSGAQVSFRVDDVERAHAAAVAAGAEVLHPPRTEPWGRSGRYRDFDGNVVEPTQPG